MNKTNLSEQLDLFIDELRLQEKSDRTLIKYKADILKFINYLSHDNEISKDDMLGFKRSIMSRKYKPATINSILIAVNKYIRWSGINDMNVKKLKVQQINSLESVISFEDYNRLLRYARILKHEDIRMIMRILGETGIRISELEFFTVESIQDYYIHIRNKGKDRDVIMTQFLSRDLKRYCRENKIKSGAIFTINTSTIWRRMKEIAGAARVNKARVHAHSFRHFFAKEYMKEFNNAIELADLLGHSDLKTTRFYTMTSKEEKRKQLEGLSKKRSQNANKSKYKS